MEKGIVYLVGAGPGDLGLVTFRAKELIERADVLVYDYLVHPDLVAWCKPECEVVYVGKRAGFHSVPQEEIERLLVKFAKAGKMVVRLKGGDPFVFGRGGEEARTLAADKVPFEVVPGITATLAAGAYAGIPLTHRNTSSALIILTGHEDPNRTELQTDWAAYGALKNATLAIYMGMGHMAEIMTKLMSGGLSPETPAAVVQWASLGRQRSVSGTVTTLPELTAEAKLGPPAIILVGEVVRHHEKVDWFEHLPLFGKRVAITRTRAQSSVLRSRLEHLGAEVLELPLIEVKSQVDASTADDVFAELGHYEWLVFTSSNGVRYFFDAFFARFKDLRSLGFLRIACVGEATAAAVRAYRLEPDFYPEDATAEALGESLIADGQVDSAKILVVTGNLNRDTLVKTLEEGRAIVDCFPVYETLKTDLSAHPAADDFREKGADAILFASSSAVKSFMAQAAALKLGPDAKRPLAGSIGPQTTITMKEIGFPLDFEAAKPNLAALIEALTTRLQSRK